MKISADAAQLQVKQDEIQHLIDVLVLDIESKLKTKIEFHDFIDNSTVQAFFNTNTQYDLHPEIDGTHNLFISTVDDINYSISYLISLSESHWEITKSKPHKDSMYKNIFTYHMKY